MSRYTHNKVIKSKISSHQASLSLMSAFPETTIPRWIEILKEQKKAGHKSAIYRLGGVFDGDSTVIAKRCRFDAYKIEKQVYENIFPHLPITTLQGFGYLLEPEGKFGWLFIEDAGDRNYSSKSVNHRELAAQWLGKLHTSTEDMVAAKELPSRKLSYYQEHLLSAIENISLAMENPVLGNKNLKILQSIFSQLKMVDGIWSEFQEIVLETPQVLIHGDIKRKNIRIFPKNKKLEFKIFDWENAAYGSVAFDLYDIDILSYFSTVKSTWSYLTLDSLRQFTYLGSILRYIASIDWVSTRLKYDWIDKPMLQCIYWENKFPYLINDFKKIR